MFGANEVVSAKFFNDAPKDSLFITSMFYTLQGEGPYAGLPCLFIRLTKCDLRCNFCDTFFDQGDWLTFTEIRAKAFKTINAHWADRGLSVPDTAMADGKAAGDPYNFGLVITGGEPLLQANLKTFLEQEIELETWKWIQIESNGIPKLELHEDITLVCSPKCNEKDGKAVKYIKPTQTILERANCLKFVMSAEPESPYSSIPEWAFKWKAETKGVIYVSPMNVYKTQPKASKMLRADSQGNIPMDVRSTKDEVISFWESGLLDMSANQRNHEYAGKYALDNGLKLNIQTHLYVSLA